MHGRVANECGLGGQRQISHGLVFVQNGLGFINDRLSRFVDLGSTLWLHRSVTTIDQMDRQTVNVCESKTDIAGII